MIDSALRRLWQSYVNKCFQLKYVPFRHIWFNCFACLVMVVNGTGKGCYLHQWYGRN